MASLLIPLNILVPVGLVIVILLVVAWIILSKNKKLYKEISSEKQKFSKYEKKIEDLKNSLSQNPEKDFEKLNEIARDFFEEYFGLSKSLTYLEMESEFKKQNKNNCSIFCRMMSDMNYKGNSISSAGIKQTAESFSEILNEKR